MKALATGQSATYLSIFFQTPRRGIGISMSITGFGEGYDNLP